MKASQLRKLYLDYFAQRGHKILPSASLIPKDPTLLFTSAGMVQFKDFFWGRIDPPFPKAATCQKCFRATDIEKVGKTAFHHTFFEMLGNFSFGDYFKEGAIMLAWEFVTEELSIAQERLWVSVYEEDEEAFAIWRDVIGLPPERIRPKGKEDNWWGPVGNTGPCGPDSEIFVDTGADKACGPDCLGPGCDCPRFSEIWNLVFMQYDAQEKGTFEPLKRKNIDTGMGLERTAAVLQAVESDFEIDLFRPIVEAIEEAASRSLTEKDSPNRNLVADHIRGALFLIADGVMPGNEKQGHVLHSILTRTVEAADMLTLPPGTLVTLVDPVIATLGQTYPEIEKVETLAKKVMAREEKDFRRVLRNGRPREGEYFRQMLEEGKDVVPGEIAFEWQDTYGIPLGVTGAWAAEHGLTVDSEGFEEELDKQRTRSRRASFSVDVVLVHKGQERASIFLGYEVMDGEGEVQGAYPTDSAVSEIVFDQTPFYAEAGGQVADTGTIENLSQQGHAEVTTVQKNIHGAFLHHVRAAKGAFSIGDRCCLIVDKERRAQIARNHTATHLLHKALREVLGDHVVQAGSLVSDEELRFDFSHFEKVTDEEIAQVEDIANRVVLEDLQVKTAEMPLGEAKASGAAAHFEEEYQGKDLVRVVSVGDFSRELCGGTHVSRSGQIGLIKIISEESVAAGTRRIRAVTGDGTLQHLRASEHLLGQLKPGLGENPVEGLNRLQEEIAVLRTRLGEITEISLRKKRDELLSSPEKVGDVSLVSGRLDTAAEEIKRLADLLEEKSRPSVVVLVGDADGRGIAICKVSKKISAIDAAEIVRVMSESLGGGGGGNRAFAQGGGPNVSRLDEALEHGIRACRSALSA